MGKENYDSIIELIKLSPRKDYILNPDNTLRFYQTINYVKWDDILKLNIVDEGFNIIFDSIKKMLVVCKVNRT